MWNFTHLRDLIQVWSNKNNKELCEIIACILIKLSILRLDTSKPMNPMRCFQPSQPHFSHFYILSPCCFYLIRKYKNIATIHSINLFLLYIFDIEIYLSPGSQTSALECYLYTPNFGFWSVRGETCAPEAFPARDLRWHSGHLVLLFILKNGCLYLAIINWDFFAPVDAAAGVFNPLSERKKKGPSGIAPHLIKPQPLTWNAR